ncbi:MAG: alpha/beta hydrolase-fold protein [Oscillospiraceae bacterium]|jgi:hypothetical protein
MHKLNTGGPEAWAFVPEGTPHAAVYLPTESPEFASGVFELIKTCCVLVGVRTSDWFSDLSPWPAPSVGRSPSFGGRADSFLGAVLKNVVPAAESELGTEGLPKCIAGYSLAGLFAIWAAISSGEFDYAVSASGSMWYPGFTGFVSEASIDPVFKRAYLSLGNKEPLSKAFSTAGKDMEAVASMLRGKGVETFCEWNRGNHFADNELRTAKGIDRILAK